MGLPYIDNNKGTDGQDDYEWIKRNLAVSQSREMTGATGGTGNPNTSSGGVVNGQNTNVDHTQALNFPSNLSRDETKGEVKKNGGGSGGSGSSGSSGVSSGSSAGTQISEPKTDTNAELLAYIKALEGKIGDSETRYADLFNQFNQSQNSWAQQLADIYAKQSEDEANWRKEVQDMYKQGQDEAYAKAEAERKKALDAGIAKAENTIAGQKEGVNQSYSDTLRQLYLQNMLGQKNIGQQLAAQGATGGLAESTLMGMNNNYSQALRETENQRTSTLNELDRQLTDAQLAASIEEATGAANAAVNRSASYMDALKFLINSGQADKANYASALTSLMNEEDARRAQDMSYAQYLMDNQRADASEERQYGYNLASQMIASGVMPTVETLTAAGIPIADAQAVVDNYKAMAAQAAAQTAASSAKAETQAKMTESQANMYLNAFANGDRSKGTVSALEQYFGAPISTIEASYGFGTDTESEGAGDRTGIMNVLISAYKDGGMSRVDEALNDYRDAGVIDSNEAKALKLSLQSTIQSVNKH